MPIRTTRALAPAAAPHWHHASVLTAPPVAPFDGLGTWIDIYDLVSAAHPRRTVARAARNGVSTIYVETGNSSQADAIVRPAFLRTLIAESHRRGIRVVAWYLPTLRDLARDRRRLIAASRIGADAIAIDIESSAVKRPSGRTRRLLHLVREVRAAVPGRFGAIIPSPPGMRLKPDYWPGFPYRELAASTDAFLPMCYFTYRTIDPMMVERYAGACTDELSTARSVRSAVFVPTVNVRVCHSARTHTFVLPMLVHQVTELVAVIRFENGFDLIPETRSMSQRGCHGAVLTLGPRLLVAENTSGGS